jgi:hypothetical protein
MSAYLTKSQEKKLRETYKAYNLKRFHSMNAAIRTSKNCCSYMGIDNATGEMVEKTSDCLQLFSYYTKCVSWYPQAKALWVSPIVSDGIGLTSTTTRQVNRFLREYVAPNVDVSVLQYGHVITEPHHVYELGELHVMYHRDSDYLTPANWI